jgi:hypothetical protein
MRMANYVPAAFTLYEFDDSTYPAPEVKQRERWFGWFNGLIGEPPQNVTLAWSDGVRRVLVQTHEHAAWDIADARSSATWVALAGTALMPEQADRNPRETPKEVERIAAADNLWFGIPDVIAGDANAEAIECDRFSLCSIQLDDTAIYIAATGLDPRRVKVRKVQNWNSYNVDGSKPFPLGSLRYP